jgi:hypothetical protein
LGKCSRGEERRGRYENERKVKVKRRLRWRRRDERCFQTWRLE